MFRNFPTVFKITSELYSRIITDWAPLTAPELAKIEPAEMTANPKVKLLMAVGVTLSIVGILLAFFLNTLFGLVILTLAAAAITVSVFAPIR